MEFKIARKYEKYSTFITLQYHSYHYTTNTSHHHTNNPLYFPYKQHQINHTLLTTPTKISPQPSPLKITTQNPPNKSRNEDKTKLKKNPPPPTQGHERHMAFAQHWCVLRGKLQFHSPIFYHCHHYLSVFTRPRVNGGCNYEAKKRRHN